MILWSQGRVRLLGLHHTTESSFKICITLQSHEINISQKTLTPQSQASCCDAHSGFRILFNFNCKIRYLCKIEPNLKIL